MLISIDSCQETMSIPDEIQACHASSRMRDQKGGVVTEPVNRRGRHSGDGGDRMSPFETFAVPENMRHLPTEALDVLERGFWQWRDEAKRADRLRSRTRICLLFELLRYSGARLGEVLALDDRRAVDIEKMQIFVGKGAQKRCVPLPEKLCRELRKFAASPAGTGLAGELFHLDPGYVRRMFYARAEQCGLPRELGAPQVLRRSRAIELLRSGVPLGVVQEILGQSSADLVSVFQNWSKHDVQDIVRRMAVDAAPLRSSARNVFSGHVAEIRRDGVMAEVVLETVFGQHVSAVITVESLEALQLDIGVPVSASIKAPLVDVVFDAEGRVSSASNCFAAEITGVRRSEVLSEITGRSVDGMRFCALLASRVLDEQQPERDGPSAGQSVCFCFKALSVVLHTL